MVLYCNGIYCWRRIECKHYQDYLDRKEDPSESNGIKEVLSSYCVSVGFCDYEVCEKSA